MAVDHKTKTNPSGSVQQCDQRHIHAAHEWQNEFGGYFNVYCPGNDGKPAKSQHFEEQVDPTLDPNVNQADPSKIELIDWDIDANRPAVGPEDTLDPPSRPAEVYERRQGLERELSTLLNRHSEENESGTPDFILAGFLIGVLDAYNKTLGERAVWRGESIELPALQELRRERVRDEQIFGVIMKLRDQGILSVPEKFRQSDIHRTLMDEDLEQGGLEAGDTLAPGALDGNDGKEVPLVVYTNGQRNEIGTAKLHVTPGEMAVTSKITGALPVFGAENISAAYSLDLQEPKDEPVKEEQGPLTAFQRYQRRGLTQQ